MQEWYIFALASIFVIAGSELSQKISMMQEIDVSAVTNNFFVWIMQGIGGIVISIAFGQLALNPSDIPYAQLGLVAVAYFFGGTFYYTSYKGNSSSISMILVSISVIVSTFLGITLFNEGTGTFKFVGIASILVSILIINFNKKERFEKYNTYALIGGICFGVAYTIDKSIVLQLSPFIYVALMCFSVAIVSLILQFKKIISEIQKLKPKNYLPMVSSAFFGTLFNFFTFMAYDKGADVGTVDAMNNSSIFLVIFFEVLIFRDRSNLLTKIVCTLLVALGVIMLNFS